METGHATIQEGQSQGPRTYDWTRPWRLHVPCLDLRFGTTIPSLGTWSAATVSTRPPRCRAAGGGGPTGWAPFGDRIHPGLPRLRQRRSGASGVDSGQDRSIWISLM